MEGCKRKKNPLIDFYHNLIQEPLYTQNKEYYLKELKRIKKNKPEVYENWIYNDRNYRLFAILANVRNHFNIIPIDYPRGLPKDVSNVVLEKYESYGIFAFSASYFTIIRRECSPIYWRDERR